MINSNLVKFLVFCIGTRSLFTYLTKTRLDLLPLFSKIAMIPALGFLIIYMFNLRKTGIEVGNKEIWWNNLRPVHGILWAIFVYLAYISNIDAWKVLALDTIIGLLASLNHHIFKLF